MSCGGITLKILDILNCYDEGGIEGYQVLTVIFPVDIQQIG